MSRIAKIFRETKETRIELQLSLDGKGFAQINSGVPFFDHMLTLFAVHGYFELILESSGDLEVDYHHTIEDIGICLGKAVRESLGDMKGINRYGSAVIPMDESLTEVHTDICNRPYLVFNCVFPHSKVGEFDTELVEEFFRAFVNHSGINLHIINRYGRNTHHIIESIFKAFSRSLKIAISINDNLRDNIMSSKGVI